MKIRQIDALWAHVHWLGVLADCGSYTAAAARLGVSKSAMSLRIGELEAAAGVPLVRRTTRSVRLTEAGQSLVDSTRGAFAQIERSFAGVRDLADAPRGLLRVTVATAFGRQYIAPLVADFLRCHPELRIELDLSERLSSLVQDGFDLAIRHVAMVPETHVAWTLCETRSLLVASPDYLRRRGMPTHPEALAAHDCLTYLRAEGTPSWHFEPEGGGPAVSVGIRGSFSANNSEVLREAVLGALGIALIPDFSARAELATGRLVRVLPDWRAVTIYGDRLCAIRPYSAHVPKAVQVFVAYLRERLGTPA
ncbi:LysR family transcriptional regulator [Zoogloea sp.]|uniref:LysR family transcriptional regulator n=1 Tax=Zoogloea sp. TaxID=49181 RepID=UPI0035B4D858